MYITILHTEYLRIRHLKKSFPARNQNSAISVIFGCLVYIHILKEKRTKLDPLGKKGIFVGYYESLKAYKIYFPWFKNIDIYRDVTFDEDSAYIKSKKRLAEEPEERRAPKIHHTTMNE